jgi:alpha-ketoglutarate-dependent taurine dioxygenase
MKTNANTLRAMNDLKYKATNICDRTVIGERNDGVWRGGAVEAEPLEPGTILPLVIRPSSSRMDLIAWASENREAIEANLYKHGGLLFRGFDALTASGFEAVIRAVSGELLEYRERSSPRSKVSNNVYTSTDHPPDQSIFVHNENSYQQTFNLKIFFYCETPAPEGGGTPITDCRKILPLIDPPVLERFLQKGWMYVRNYGDGFGLSWQTVFQTEDKGVVENHCRKNGIQVEWKDGDRLRTRAVLPAVSRHPRTAEPIWFNHATFFHYTTLEPWIQEVMLEEFDNEEDFPTNTLYGDGTPIERSALDRLREIYRRHTVTFAWERGDVLMLDNMMVAHGRAPYSGDRRILVGMSEPTTRPEVAYSGQGSL